MAEEKISIKFYLNISKVKAGKYPVYVRMTVNRKKTELATDIWLKEDQWDEQKQRTRKDDKANETLAKIERDIYDTKYKLNKENKTISAHSIKAFYRKDENLDPTLLNYFELYIQKLKLANELVKGSISRYEDTKDHLEKFLEFKKQLDRRVSSIDFKFVAEFDLYLLNQKSGRGEEKMLERNTVNKHHTRLKTVLIRAINEGALSRNPYNDFKFKYTPSKRTFLTPGELKKITDHSFDHNKTLERVKDIFLFSVYTGLRFVDAQNLTANKIVPAKDGTYYINLIQNKTQQQQMIPMLQNAVKIFKKYDNAERRISGKVLPKISNQKLNTYLKEIGILLGIEKTLSHHVARHTCATTVLLSNEAPIEAVSKWLGHTNIRTTQIYAKITNEYLSKVAQKVESKI